MHLSKRLIKLGGSCYVSLPAQCVESWGLGKGSEVRLEVRENAVVVTPPPTGMEALSPGDLARVTEALEGIKMQVTIEGGGTTLRLQFAGKGEVVKPLVRNLWRWLPVTLAMLGVRTVEELPQGSEQ